MRPARTAILWMAAVLCLASSLFSAPLPPVGQADTQGVIESAQWVPQKRQKAIRGMSGSAGLDRTFPAHFVVVLKNWSGPTTRQAAMMNSFVGTAAAGGKSGARQERLTVWINTPDSSLLKSGMTIRVPGYTVSGDEGGTWAHHEPVQVLKAAP